jgi:hypothetical protein
MMAVLTSIENVGRLHVPSFFCMETVEVLSQYTPIGWYRELPDGQGPDFNTLSVVPGDAVLAVNLFGRSDRYQWDLWHREHPSIVLIEDHTHDPLSDWSQSSNADYAVASLRKTLPIPIGAMLWSPSGLPVPAPRDDDACTAALLRMMAMTLKAAWLEGSRIRKEDYRQLYSTGDRLLFAAHSSTATPLTSDILSCLDVWRMRAVRSENARTFMTLLDTSSTADTQNRLWAPLRHGARDDAAPFNVQLLCASESVRDALVQHMIRHRIYPAIHWRQRDTPVTSGDAEAIDCAARIMTIPLDYRYSSHDIQRIVRTLHLFGARDAAPDIFTDQVEG